jgi:phenylalanyl-tRNA synthetase alpha chain
MTRVLTQAELARALALRDLSDPACGPHAMQLILSTLVHALTARWRCPAIIHRANPVISLHQNYERLRVPREATARDARYTRYVKEDVVLRTSATAMLPPLLDRLAAEPPDYEVLLAPVGLVYRRDAIDRLHVGEPHQLDLWRLRRRAPQLQQQDLEEMIQAVAAVIAPGAIVRCSATEHPYTLCGRQIDVQVGGEWVEIGECGLAHPALLAAAGLDTTEWSGLAMGIGLDRAVMLAKGIDDIRLLRSDDPRVAAQMLDLTAYRPVSKMPAVRRDLSLATSPGLDAEALGDRLREQLGERALAIEDLQVVCETPLEDLPRVARERLGMRPGQVNLLVRLVLRHPTETLTDSAANLLRDDVYAVLHEGSVHQWAAR